MQAESLILAHKWVASHPEELEKYRGKWIAVLDGNIISVGNSYDEVFKEIRHFIPKNYPLITYVLKKEEENLIA